jgi:glycosyltransferase involved in cell wall biosynthesis
MNTNNKILIVTESIDINDSSGTKGRVTLIHNLQKAGFQVRVLHYSRKDMHLNDIPSIAIKEQKLTLLYILAKIQLLIQRITKLNINKPVENLLGFSFTFLNDSFSIQKALKKEVPNEYQWLLTLSKGASFRPHHAILKSPNWHGKWLAYIHDPYPFHRYPEPYDWYMPGYKQKEMFFHKLAQKAKYLVFPSASLQEWMEKWYPDMKGKGVVIPHQIPAQVSEKHPVPNYFLKEGFTLLHAGNLMKQRPPKVLVKGFELFLKQMPEAKAQLLLVGPASYHQEFLDKAVASIPQLYVSKGYVEYKEVQSLQENASVNIILEADAASSPFLPGKFPHCVVTNALILLIGPKNSETFRLLGETYPWQTENRDAEKICQLIKQLYLRWKNAPESFQLNRNDLEDYMGCSHLETTIQKLKH